MTPHMSGLARTDGHAGTVTPCSTWDLQTDRAAACTLAVEAVSDLQGYAVAGECYVAVPVAAQVGQAPGGCQVSVMEGGLAQDCHSRLGHHVLSPQDLQEGGLACSIATNEEAPGPPWQGDCHALYHGWDTWYRPAICTGAQLILHSETFLRQQPQPHEGSVLSR